MNVSFTNDPSTLGTSGYERRELDFYPTPAWVTEALFPWIRKHVNEDDFVWEPACGTGAMSEVLRQCFKNVVSTDIADYGYSYGRPWVDFLKQHGYALCGEPWIDFSKQFKLRYTIVTNPPYDKAEAFIRHAISIAPVTAMLLRHEYDCAASRVDLFDRPPFARQIVLTSRPRWIPGTTVAPRFSYSWFIWDHKWSGEPVKNYYIKPKGKEG